MTIPEFHTEQGYILAATPARGGATRVFRTTEIVTRSEAWREAKEEGRYGGTPPWLGPLTDNLTGETFWARPAACGAGCYCAAAYRTTKPRA